MRKLLEYVGLAALLAVAMFVAHEVYAQAPKPRTATPPPAVSVSQADLEAFVAKEFGEGFKLSLDVAPIAGDFDGDGRQDLMVVATGENPLMSEGKYNFKTLDPYNASFGFGNPKITMTFNASDSVARYLLIAHNWQSPTKKFVLVNVPFKQLRLGHMMLKKKAIDAIESIDISGVQGAIYWDGKKYKWEIIGADFEQRTP